MKIDKRIDNFATRNRTIKMTFRITILFCFLATFAFSQKKGGYRALIDSIQNQKWKKTTLDVDSLDTAPLITIKKQMNDSLILETENRITAYDELPITPFRLNKFELPKKWNFYGKNDLFFNQASFSNWNTGGQNNIGVLAKLEYHLDYKNYHHYLENIFSFGYGWNSSKGQSSRKTEDYINIMSNYGYDLGKNYYLSAGFQFISQFSAGFDYNATPDPNYDDRISKFLAPAYLNAGLGISYNPSKNFQIIVRPINGKFTFVGDRKLQKKGRYGLERDGQSIRKELGAMLKVSHRWNIYKGMYWDNRLNLFSNYIDHPERVDIYYNSILNIKFNQFITTMVSLDLVYDHDQVQQLQTKQTLGVGFSYTLGQRKNQKRKKTIAPFVK